MPDFLDRLGGELRRAAGEEPLQPTATLGARPARARARARRLPPLHARRWLIAALALVVVGASAAAVATRSGPTPGPVPPREGATLASTPEPRQLAAFSLLRRAQTGTDQLTARNGAVFSGASGANIGLSRRVAAGAGAGAWVVPGRNSMCLLATWPGSGAAGAACVPDTVALDGRLAVASASVRAPGTQFLAGLVPDRVGSVLVHLRAGTVQRLAVRENVYMSAFPAPVEAVTFAGPHGAVRVEGLGLPIHGPGRG
jgi:hypothetical protein